VYIGDKIVLIATTLAMPSRKVQKHCSSTPHSIHSSEIPGLESSHKYKTFMLLCH